MYIYIFFFMMAIKYTNRTQRLGMLTHCTDETYTQFQMTLNIYSDIISFRIDNTCVYCLVVLNDDDDDGRTENTIYYYIIILYLYIIIYIIHIMHTRRCDDILLLFYESQLMVFMCETIKV